MLRRLTKFLPSNFTLALLVTVLLATLLPTSGRGAAMFNDATVFAIGLLFFMHGAKLPRETLIAGLKHWRLHLTVLSFTYVLFPLLGWAFYRAIVHRLYLDCTRQRLGCRVRGNSFEFIGRVYYASLSWLIGGVA